MADFNLADIYKFYKQTYGHFIEDSIEEGPHGSANFTFSVPWGETVNSQFLLDRVQRIRRKMMIPEMKIRVMCGMIMTDKNEENPSKSNTRYIYPSSNTLLGPKQSYYVKSSEEAARMANTISDDIAMKGVENLYANQAKASGCKFVMIPNILCRVTPM